MTWDQIVWGTASSWLLLPILSDPAEEIEAEVLSAKELFDGTKEIGLFCHCVCPMTPLPWFIILLNFYATYLRYSGRLISIIPEVFLKACYVNRFGGGCLTEMGS